MKTLTHEQRIAIAGKTLAELKRLYPAPAANLHADTPWQLLFATVLSAQCTDARVNSLTPGLFRRWPTPKALAAVPLETLEEAIRPTGFYRNKARNLLAAARRICEAYGGEVPNTLDALLTLPGVARKTANCVLFGAFGINAGLAVDTHVRRISFRLGLTDERAPEAIERDLMRLFPQSEWGGVNHRMVWFGRDVCRARRPDCENCALAAACPKREPPKDAAPARKTKKA